MLTFLERFGINRIVVALSTARMADAFGSSILIVLIPLYVVELPSLTFNLPTSVLVGILISLYGLAFTFLQPFSGALSDYIGRRKIFIQGGLLVMGISTLAFIFAEQYIHLLAIRFLQGLGVALTVPAALGVMAASTVKASRGGAMGFYSTMRMIGFAVGPAAGGWLHAKYGFDSAFYVGAGSLLLALLLVQWWVKEEPAPPKTERPTFKVFDRQLLGNGLGFLGMATFFMAIAFSFIATLENEYNVRLDQTAFQFGIAYSGLTWGRLAFQFPLGRLSDRIGRKRVIILGMLVLAPATAWLGYVTSTAQLTAGRVLQGLASAGVAAPTFALAGDLAKKGGEGQQMSVIAMGFGLGIAVGPLMAGWLSVYFFELPFIVGALLTLVGAWLINRFVQETVTPT
jgi:MFS family permease